MKVSEEINIKKYNRLISTLKLLKTHVEGMLKVTSDPLLVWQKNEINDWLDFLMTHTDIEELQSLEVEVNNRFFHKFNVRIEPKNLDNDRLETFEKLIYQFHTLLN